MRHHVGTILKDAASRAPNDEALIGDVHVTYGELHARAEMFAATLAERTAPGDGVGIFVQSNEDFVISFFAATYAGLTVLPFVRSAPLKDVRRRLQEVEATSVISDADVGGPLCLIPPPGRENLSKTAEFDLLYPPQGDGLWLPTSGTSGRSKVARISHECLVVHTRNLVRETFRFDRSDVILATLPLCHSFGLRTTLLASFSAGARVALLERFDAERSLAHAADLGVTFIAGVPTMFASWAQTTGPTIPSLRWCLSAGAPLADATRRAAERRLGAEVRQGYGLTEASFTSIDAPHHGKEPGSCGLPSPGVDVRIRNGEIQIRGPNVMSAYLHDEEATRDAFDDGWLRTGDVGEVDDAGCVHIRDRIKDLVIRGGHNIVPSVVEAALREIPGVREAAVVGRPDALLGEELVAVLVADDKSAVLSNIYRHIDSSLAKHERPRECAFVDSLPTGPSRKVLRRVLRDDMEAGMLSVFQLSRKTGPRREKE